MAQGLDVHVDQVLALDEYPTALARLEAGEQLGKDRAPALTDAFS